jgi:hypothetical protein
MRVLRVLLVEGQDGVHALGAQVGAADQPLVSLKGVGMSSGHALAVVTSEGSRAAGC